MAFMEELGRLVREPPVRLLVQHVLRFCPTSLDTRVKWNLSRRGPYLLGLAGGVFEAQQRKIDEICAIEFGVAGGSGLLVLQREAALIEKATGVRIRVVGFDCGSKGLPEFIGDYRDHPDIWSPGDYPMNEEALRGQLTDRTELILGNVAETVCDFVERRQSTPIGFISFDLDLYSSTRDAMQILSHPKRQLLHRFPLYFDDILLRCSHRYAGEFLAIEEFNQTNKWIKIDRWYGARRNKVFKEHAFYDQMYMVHDLEAINRISLDRRSHQLPLRGTHLTRQRSRRPRVVDDHAEGT